MAVLQDMQAGLPTRQANSLPLIARQNSGFLARIIETQKCIPTNDDLRA